MPVPPGYKHTVVDVIPTDWDVRTIGDEFEVSAGGDWDRPNSTKAKNHDFPFPIYANALTNDGIQGYCRYWTIPGDSLTITGRGDVGKAVFRTDPFVPIVRLLALVPKRGASAGFYASYINSRLKFALESTGVPQLTAPQVRSYAIAVPPVDEQWAIAVALADVNDQVTTLEWLIAKKEAIKQGMMQQLLTGRTRLPGFVEPWRDFVLGDVVTYIKTVALSRAQLDVSSPLRYLHYGDIHNSHTVALDAAHTVIPCAPVALAKTAMRLQVGDLVLVDASEDRIGVGKSVEITSVPQGGIVAGLHTIAARFDKSVLADGFKAYLQFIPAFRDALLRLAAGTKVLATTRSHVSSVVLSLPNADEQRAIAGAIRDYDIEIEALCARLSKVKSIKQGMMQELLTGRTRLPVVEEEP
jgi:type I restriction enzyme, S subunit